MSSCAGAQEPVGVNTASVADCFHIAHCLFIGMLTTGSLVAHLIMIGLLFDHPGSPSFVCHDRDKLVTETSLRPKIQFFNS